MSTPQRVESAPRSLGRSGAEVVSRDARRSRFESALLALGA
jgi:hypothetical protein